MYRKSFSFLILFSLLSICSNSQTIGVRGSVVYPRVVNIMDLPNLGEIEIGPIIDGHFNEGKPPEANEFPAPNAEDLPHVTYDKGRILPPFMSAPVIGVNFEGIAQTLGIPGEPQPAVGPNHVVVLGNVSIKITDKSGTVITNTDQSTFFGIPSAEGPGFDSKCFYDYRHGRFVLLCETQTTSPNVCSYYLAISQTNSAAGSWFIYKFDMTKDGITQTSNWSDFPGLGLSDDKLVMSGQQFSFGGNLYQYQKLRIIDRAVAYAGGSLTFVDIVNWSGQVFVTKPGRNISAGDTVHILATTFSGGTSVQYRRLTGTPAAPVLSAGTTISCSAYGSLPAKAPGGSATATVVLGDSRTPDFFVRNGILHIAFHAGINFGGGPVESSVKYLKIQVSPLNTTLLTDENYGATDIYYYYPMVTVDSVGTIMMGFDRSSASEFSSSWITGKRRSDANIQSSVLAKTGTAVTSQSRWGDFTGIDMDNSASNNVVSYAWYSGQWTKGSATFGTWVSQFSLTYGKISGQVVDDADGDISTTGDRTPYSGATVTLKQGVSTIATTITDASGNYTFGYLETATNYSISFAPPGVKHSMDVIPGSGGTSQSKTDYKTIAVNLTDAQTSSGNNYIVSDWLTSIASGNWNVSATWIDNVTPSATEKVFVSSGTTVTINTDFTCNNINDKGVLQFDNILTRTCSINSGFIFSNGTVTMGSNVMIFLSTSVISGASSSSYFITDGTGYIKRSNLGSSLNVLFPIGTATSYNPVMLNNSGTADDFLARVQSTFSPPPIDPTKVVNRMWIISESVPGGSNATVTLQYNTGDFPGTFNNTAGNTDIGRYNGTSWVETSATWANPSAGVFTATASGFTAFSPFGVGNQGALPIELTSFTYQTTSARDIKLNWATSLEVNNSGFELDRSVKGSNTWTSVGFIPGHGTTNQISYYTFSDKKLGVGKYEYRLKQIDYNSNFEYFALNSVMNIGIPVSFGVSQNYPNPSNPVSKIDYQIPFTGKVIIKVYDLAGREVKTLVDQTQDAGYYNAVFDGTNLASGIYIYRVEARDASTSLSMTKTMKMVLIK
jgi:hypothetical protein